MAKNGLTWDFEKHEVYVNGKEVHLGTIEFRLLKYLIESRGQVRDRDQLFNAGWELGPDGYMTDPRNVDQMISRLRKRLASAAPHIKTVQGYGYKFKA